MANPDRRLTPLEELDDYAVASGDPDPRGWEVSTSDGRRVGRVADLIVDTEAMKARYLDVKVDPSVVPMTPVDRHVLVPAAAVRIGDRERSEERIHVAVAPEVVARAAAAAPTGDTLNEYDSRWPVVIEGACEVRVIRGGQDG